MKARILTASEIDDESTPEVEPGLPAALPEGETILWRGAPTFIGLAVHAFHVRAIAIYFIVVALWRAAAMASVEAPVGEIASTTGVILVFGAVAIALLSLIAWLMQRETVYTITTNRVVMRYGVALRKTVNIPFRIIGGANLKQRKNGVGDIPLSLAGPDRIAYIHLWPHVRPMKFANAEPMLRAIPDAARVARILADAVKAKAPHAIDVAPIAAAPRPARPARKPELHHAATA